MCGGCFFSADFFIGFRISAASETNVFVDGLIGETEFFFITHTGKSVSRGFFHKMPGKLRHCQTDFDHFYTGQAEQQCKITGGIPILCAVADSGFRKVSGSDDRDPDHVNHLISLNWTAFLLLSQLLNFRKAEELTEPAGLEAKGVHMKEYSSLPAFETMEKSPQGYEAHCLHSEHMEVSQYHCHDYFEFYLHLHGGQFMGVDNHLYALRPNQVFILPPFFMHGLNCREEMQNYDRAFLNISPEVLQRLGCGQIDLVSYFRSNASAGRYTYQLSSEAAGRFVSCLRQIQEQSRMPSDQFSRFRDCSRMMEALQLICDAMGEAPPVESERLTNSLIQDVLLYINTHYTEPINVSGLARMFNVSSSYLSHEFSRFTNRSVYEYVIYRRIMLSRQRMLGEESLNTIAFQCGFNDYSNFLRSFSHIVGMSPRAYRNQLRDLHGREA